MAIELNGKTKLTTETENLFIELGGGDPYKTLTRQELSQALANALNAVPEDSSIPKKLCDHFYAAGALDKYLCRLDDS